MGREEEKKKRYEEAMKNVEPQYQFLMGMFTCDNCDIEEKCKCSWDPYNTDGDCLMDK